MTISDATHSRIKRVKRRSKKALRRWKRGCSRRMRRFGRSDVDIWTVRSLAVNIVVWDTACTKRDVLLFAECVPVSEGCVHVFKGVSSVLTLKQQRQQCEAVRTQDQMIFSRVMFRPCFVLGQNVLSGARCDSPLSCTVARTVCTVTCTGAYSGRKRKAETWITSPKRMGQDCPLLTGLDWTNRWLAGMIWGWVGFWGKNMPTHSGLDWSGFWRVGGFWPMLTRT
jgi:hypothetical protein